MYLSKFLAIKKNIGDIDHLMILYKKIKNYKFIQIKLITNVHKWYKK